MSNVSTPLWLLLQAAGTSLVESGHPMLRLHSELLAPTNLNTKKTREGQK